MSACSHTETRTADGAAAAVADSSLDEIRVTGGTAPGTQPAAVPTREMRAKKAEMQSALGAMSARTEPLAAPSLALMPALGEQNRETYAHLEANPLHRAGEQPVSTFSVDVDTGSYANLRRLLREGQLPPADAVRVEELVNYFDYGYAAPRDRSTPFALTTEMAPTPWNPRTRLLHIGIQGWKPDAAPRAMNLVFLVDVSGSMNDSDKLPLVKTALRLLTAQLTARDHISLVVYAGASGVVLEPTAGDQKARILAALEQLQAGGSTNGAAGIDLAYAMARRGWIEGGVNRVLLATDGDFNVGVTRFESLLDLVKDKRKSGIALTTLGFGTGNYNDQLMEQLADAGDGNYAYIDSAQEAQKVLVRQRESTLTTIARDVKVQVEFNPAVVAEYRLIGYENRALRREDFSNDAVDAGEIGAGHSVTALYEVALVGGGGEQTEPLRYGQRERPAGDASEIAHLRLRYKRPEDGVQAPSRLIERPLLQRELLADIGEASPQLRLSAAVAAFGQLLRGGSHLGAFDYTAVQVLARSAGEDAYGERAEFCQLVDLAKALSTGLRQVGENEQQAGG